LRDLPESLSEPEESRSRVEEGLSSPTAGECLPAIRPALVRGGLDSSAEGGRKPALSSFVGTFTSGETLHLLVVGVERGLAAAAPRCRSRG
jgi:hypothetical protein